MSNLAPPGYWHLGNAFTQEYAFYLAEKHLEATSNGGYMIKRIETDKKIKWVVFAKDEKK